MGDTSYTHIFDWGADEDRAVFAVVNNAKDSAQAQADARDLIERTCQPELKGREIFCALGLGGDALRTLHLAPGSVVIYHGQKTTLPAQEPASRDLPAPLNKLWPAGSSAS